MITKKELAYILVEEMFPDRIKGLNYERWSDLYDRAEEPNSMGVQFVFLANPWATDAVSAADRILKRLEMNVV